MTVLLHLPGRVPQRCAGSSIGPCPGFPFRASGAVCHTPTFSTAGTSGASQVLRRLSSCMPRPEDAGGPPPPRHVGGIVLPSGAFKPSASAIAMSKLYQHFRVRGHPYGLQDALSTLRPSCSPQASLRLRHGRKTRYGWVASPSPTRTFTLQETPSLSWRDNAGPQARRAAGATQERSNCLDCQGGLVYFFRFAPPGVSRVFDASAWHCEWSKTYACTPSGRLF